MHPIPLISNWIFNLVATRGNIKLLWPQCIKSARDICSRTLTDMIQMPIHNISVEFFNAVQLLKHDMFLCHSHHTPRTDLWYDTCCACFFFKYDLQNPMSNSQLKVTIEGITSYRLISLPFHVIAPTIPVIQLFQKFTLKIQGQGHGWGQSSKSQCESNILSTHIPLVPCKPALPFLRYSIFKNWPWKMKVKVIAQGHIVVVTPYWFISLLSHVDWSSHSWDTAISKFDVENSRSR